MNHVRFIAQVDYRARRRAEACQVHCMNPCSNHSRSPAALRLKVLAATTTHPTASHHLLIRSDFGVGSGNLAGLWTSSGNVIVAKNPQRRPDLGRVPLTFAFGRSLHSGLRCPLTFQRDMILCAPSTLVDGPTRPV